MQFMQTTFERWPEIRGFGVPDIRRGLKPMSISRTTTTYDDD